MSKELKINGCVRIGYQTFVAGQEKELEAAASSDELSRLAESGVISGAEAKPKEAAPKEETTEDTETVESLTKLTRDELSKRAQDAGLDGNSYSNKKEMAAAIIAANSVS